MGKTVRTSQAIWLADSKRWMVKVQKNGERRSFYSSTPGRKGKTEAENQADDWLKLQTGDDLRFDAAWAEFMKDLRDRTGEANVRNRDSLGRTWLLPTLKLKRLSVITQNDMQKCINAVAKAGNSKRQCINVRTAITAFCKYGRTRRWPIEQPYDLKIPTEAPEGEKRILQPDSLNYLFNVDTELYYGKERPAFFIHAFRLTTILGFRRGEVCGLKRADIQENTLTIRRAINNLNIETGGKNKNARRDAELPLIAQAIIDDQMAMLKRLGIISPWLFPDENGERLDSNHFYKRWKHYREQLSTPVSLHELRHTFISVMKEDMPLSLMKPIIGHSVKMDTIRTYGHTVDGEKQRAANIIDQVFSRYIKQPRPADQSEL